MWGLERLNPTACRPLLTLLTLLASPASKALRSISTKEHPQNVKSPKTLVKLYLTQSLKTPRTFKTRADSPSEVTPMCHNQTPRKHNSCGLNIGRPPHPLPPKCDSPPPFVR